DGFVVNTILKEADLFCPNSVRINFTIYHLSNAIFTKNQIVPRLTVLNKTVLSTAINRLQSRNIACRQLTNTLRNWIHNGCF
ncbi:hypothetical protein EFP46_06935, partial [Lacticaseibacillus paracasei]|nr:hypothetical protein [Lacticaseibacillus paracasei]MCT3366264.1 hypothetical protein [Lacticaseibacillus paracasei]MCT3376936.1 hypothetical protein [Lacticaseibacillus paracasei]